LAIVGVWKTGYGEFPYVTINNIKLRINTNLGIAAIAKGGKRF
jgi:hypothetical protein